MVTSSGSLILFPMDSNFPPPINGINFTANARLRQKPAPPVANQNLTDCCKEKKIEIKKGVDKLHNLSMQLEYYIYIYIQL